MRSSFHPPRQAIREIGHEAVVRRVRIGVAAGRMEIVGLGRSLAGRMTVLPARRVVGRVVCLALARAGKGEEFVSRATSRSEFRRPLAEEGLLSQPGAAIVGAADGRTQSTVAKVRQGE